MSRLLHLHAIAQRDLSQAADFIRQDSPRSALRFLRAARATFERLLDFPEIGTAYESATPEFAGLRVFPISGFENYLLFYRLMPDGIEVLRVLHGSRDWQILFGKS